MVTACGDDGGSNKDGIAVFDVQPENPLIPGNTTETGGGRIVETLFTGLVSYDPKTSNPKNAVADSITSTNDDAQHYTFKLKEGWKFHDGTTVKAKNFVDAWNYTVYTPNAQSGASFFSSIQGYSDAHTVDPDETGPEVAPTPAATTMSGLAVVDDYTFTVTLSAPFAVFPTMLGYSAFSPLPDSFFADKAAFEKHPIGNGPFMFVSQDTQKVVMKKFGDYKGDDKAHVDKVTWTFYSNDVTAYRDVENSKLDFMDQIPLSQLGTYKDDFDGRNGNNDVAVIQIIDFPDYDAKYSNPLLRQAFSMAVNREEIADAIFDGTRTPATGFVSPTVDGYEADVCEYCVFDKDKAKALFQQSGASASETYEIWYNSDGGHKDWIEAVASSISETLGVTVTAQGSENFRDIRLRANAREFTQMFRAGWQGDYPSIENYLNPLYRTGASSNDEGFSDAAVDAKLQEADSTGDLDKAISLYQEAEKLIAAQMPVMPMFYVKQQAVWSKDVKNVTVDWKGDLDVASVELK
jgi:oligopeptide transport system substrate-binding protein